jgi:putative ABC transport system permease protein
VLSSFRPVTVLKGKLKNSSGGILLRKSLVVFQFMASVALIAGTLIVYRQLNFMMNRDLGLDIAQVLVLDRPGLSPSRADSIHGPAVELFRSELKKNPDIEGVTMSITIPGKQREYKTTVKKYGAPDDQSVEVRVNSMDYDFIDVYKMKLMAGRPFAADFVHDQDTSIVITQSAAELLGFKKPEDAIGQTIAINDFQWNPIIVGVVNDYHQVSLKKHLDPTIFYCTVYWGEYYSIRVNTDQLQGTVNHVQEAWNKAFPGNPFEYFFLEDYFNKQYENERKFGSLFTTFAGLAVFVGCLGLFGLSAYTATQRTKEIGIRKVLGSSESGIFVLLSKEYIKLIAISIVLASPLIWWLMNYWMQGFPYKAPINITVFLIAGMVVLLVSLMTVSFQTMRAARANPVDALRTE